MQPKTAILDFDDLCDGNDPYDSLVRLHERDPGFKVTLFAIPTRCSQALFDKYAAISDWCALGVHGWAHARHECLGWTSEETQDKLARSLEFFPQFQKIFKAPNWEIDKEVYFGCKNAGFVVADHIKNIEILPHQPHYIYNIRLRNDTFQRLHGHVQPWNGTGLTENVDELLNDCGVNRNYILPVGTPYAFCTDAVSVDKVVGIETPDYHPAGRVEKEFGLPQPYAVATTSTSRKPSLDEYDDTKPEA